MARTSPCCTNGIEWAQENHVGQLCGDADPPGEEGVSLEETMRPAAITTVAICYLSFR